MEAIASTLHKRILPDYDPTQPLDEDLPDDKDDNGDGHEAPNDDEDHDPPPSIHPPPSWLMASFEANLQLVKDSVIGHGASTKITIYEHLRSFGCHIATHSSFFNNMTFLPPCYTIPASSTGIRWPLWTKSGVTSLLALDISHGMGIGIDHVVSLIWRTRTGLWTLAGQFPAHLTHHSGMSDSVLILMQCCFQNGMGAKQFSDSLQVMHHRRYEMLEVKYLQIVESRAKALTSLHQTYQPFPSFDDKTVKSCLIAQS
ncbi:hypothetical protein IW261DRAFT_1428185 [Armillaria novae-zelandiae]|uniref:Uncharacterized protein n=1 Tax=Armillaria novae-zelandiae TaxID=153914 RepID=A0AA39NAP5_9AGAR|nr:hypothetical protein IW261DRAFT_1428185 [Armillaria novae-zelandiae]